jgi:L-arabinose isomerase
MIELSDFEVWFVTGSINVYGESVLQRVAADTEEIAAFLDAAREIPVRVTPRPVVVSSEEIRCLIREANASANCVGIIAWMHTFSPARMWIAGLSALQRPLLHLHTQFNRDLPWSEIDMDFMNLNQSAHGDREFAFLETRMRLARKTVVGHWQDPSVLRGVGTWTRAACGWHEAHNLRIARFGDNMRDVAVTEGDKVEAELRLGISVNGYGVNGLAQVVREVPDSAADALVRDYEQVYELVPSLCRDGDRRDSIREAARIEVGLRAFLEEGGFKAFTDTFEDLGTLRQLPGIAAQRLMADGYGFGAEGDWKTAAFLRIVKVMTVGLQGGTSFMEDYTYDLAPDGAKVLGAHMLEVCPSIASSKPRCEIHPLAFSQRDDPVRLVFTASPGPGVAAAWLDMGERFRMVANEIDVVSPDADLPELSVPRAVWRPKPNLPTAAAAWMIAGGPHHMVFSTAATPELLSDFAEIARTELLMIDDTTRMRDFKNEVRWNQAYYHLARGL